ncbi:uncharacterized protein LOC143613783 [Bidens hawaiensis]|uniref:uncharacterized protein LOC143613783 n=1 Tax=Bidens hawaiensis TaxID=980011 RepID=UPI00404B787C
MISIILQCIEEESVTIHRISEGIPLGAGLDNIIEDTLKFESTVLRFLYPHLNLDPTPTLEFRSDEIVPKIDLGIDGELRKRKRRSVLTNVNSVLDRFLKRHAVPQRNPVKSASFVTSGYATNLISTRSSQ